MNQTGGHAYPLLHREASPFGTALVVGLEG
jgi:hypothetical protein